ncbi:hypothetical protein A0J61_11398 [Choanephora cucurbitarum]|uniref:Uncharacterized protein n=1 Tax=Choanephora cucurbitarum TaxID=101091 RepID=A0A1C7MUM4_9FUNG|nr:hypothetical protein A0J61_11398 [Choanephora cucurbitarum]
MQRIPRPVRITPAARDAAARTFLPVSGSQGFSFMYLPCRSKEPISAMREKLRKLKLQSSRLLDIHYPTNNVMAMLVHNDYLEEATNLLQLNKIDLIENFSPDSPNNLSNPKLADLTHEERIATAINLHQTRLTNIALRIRQDQRKLAVARAFHKQAWITTEQFVSLVQTVRPSTQPPAPSTSTNMQIDSSDDSPADGSTLAHSN